MPDLFSPLDECRRDRLRARGWREVADTLGPHLAWLRPDGVRIEEAEAFRQLETLEHADILSNDEEGS